MSEGHGPRDEDHEAEPASVRASSPRVPDAPAHGARPLYTRPSLLLLVVLGGAVGTWLRYMAEEAAPARAGGWPWTTFWINVLGSLVLGLLLTVLARSGPDQGRRRQVRLAAGTGFCGGFTTYSTFIIEIDTLLRDGWAAVALGYALTSVLVGIGAGLLGVLIGRALPRRTEPAVA